MRQQHLLHLLPLALLAVVAASGCRFGEAHFTSSIDGRGFDPGGTVFAYVDEHDAALVAENDPRVVVAMTWVVFNAGADLGDTEGSDLADMQHEAELRDGLSLVFDHQGVVDVGEDFESQRTGDLETGDGRMTARIYLAPERLTSTSTYADLVPFASLRTTKVSITEASFEAGGAIGGDITITFARGDSDPGDAREGAFTGAFRAPIAEERIAEQNLGLLDTAALSGLPLQAREGA